MINLLEFPVSAFSEQGAIHISMNADELTTCSRKAYTSGYFDGLVLVDSSGRKVTITGAERVGISRHCSVMDLIFLNPKLKVKLNFKEKSSILLSDFKGMVTDSLKENRIVWESGGDFDDLVFEINRQENISDVMSLIWGRTSRLY